MNRICTYGLYRKDQVNYEFVIAKYGADSLKYKKTMNLRGYRMYDNIYGPTIEFTGDNADKIVVDLMLASDKVYNILTVAEDGDCYFEQLLNIDYEFYSIFIQWPIKDDLREVEDGDWSRYIN